MSPGQRNHPIGPPGGTDPTVIRLVDQIGSLWAQHGRPRQVGRALGYLLFCGRSAVSSDELKEALRASAGGVSAAVRNLMSIGYVHAVAGPERRKNYYAVVDDPWTVQLRDARTHVLAWVATAETARDQLADVSPDGARRAEQLLAHARLMDVLYLVSIDRRDPER